MRRAPCIYAHSAWLADWLDISKVLSVCRLPTSTTLQMVFTKVRHRDLYYYVRVPVWLPSALAAAIFDEEDMQGNSQMFLYYYYVALHACMRFVVCINGPVSVHFKEREKSILQIPWENILFDFLTHSIDSTQDPTEQVSHSLSNKIVTALSSKLF